MPEDVRYYLAFQRLSDSRGLAQGVGALPITQQAILAYAEFHGIDDYHERQDLDYFIHELDRAWLQEVNKQ